MFLLLAAGAAECTFVPANWLTKGILERAGIAIFVENEWFSILYSCK